MLVRLAVLAVAVSARRAEERSESLSPVGSAPRVEPHRLLSQCIQFKETGAFWERTLELQNNVFHALKGKKIVVVIPTDMDSTRGDHSAPRQYARVLQAYEPLAKTFNLTVAPYYKNGTHWTALPEDTGEQLFVAFGMAEAWGDLPQQMHSRGSKMMMIHDSLCFEQNGPQLHDFAIGCPLLAPDFIASHPGGIPPEGMYFAPWGTEKSMVSPDKSQKPSMIVDATRSWVDIEAGDFVRAVRELYPTMKISVLSDGDIDLHGAVEIDQYKERLPVETFLHELSTSWFFVTGISSSYELSLSDASMAGAVLVDVNRASKKTVTPPTTVYIDNATAISTVMDSAIRRFKDDSLAEKTRKWAEAFHSEKYVALNLACSLFAEMKGGDRKSWSNLQFASDMHELPQPQPQQPQQKQQQQQVQDDYADEITTASAGSQ